jgi:hypothetical protein
VFKRLGCNCPNGPVCLNVRRRFSQEIRRNARADRPSAADSHREMYPPPAKA